MKVRSGFVSNSSSASYTVRYKYSFNILLDLFNESEIGYDRFWLRREIQKRLQHIIDILDSKISEDTSYRHDLENDYKDLEEKMNRLDEMSTLERFDTLCNISGIIYTSDELNTMFSCMTSMHNSYDEGVSNVMKNIILYLLFEHHINPLICTVDHDDR